MRLDAEHLEAARIAVPVQDVIRRGTERGECRDGSR